MKEGAEILVRTCAGVQPSEDLVVVTDMKCMPIAEVVAHEAAEVGAVVCIVVQPNRSIDNEEPGSAVAAAPICAKSIKLPPNIYAPWCVSLIQGHIQIFNPIFLAH